MMAMCLVGLASACGAGGIEVPVAPSLSRARTRDEARRRLHDLSERYEALMTEHGLHEHGRYAGTLKEGPDASAAMERLRTAERDVFAEAVEILKRFGEGVVSPRRAELWRRGELGLRLLADPRSAELSDELEAVINSHEYRLGDQLVTRAKLTEMRRSDDARERRAVRTLQHDLHVKAVPMATALIRRRQELAKELGLRSFWAALLEVRGGEVATTERVLGELSRRTQLPFARALGSGPPQRGRLAFFRRMALPWDLDHRLERLAPMPDARFPADTALATVFRIYRAFGFDFERSGVDLKQRDFAFGGQTIAVKVPNDVRLVVTPLSGARFHGLLLHELGHAFAVHATRETEPLFKGYEWVPGLLDPAYAEGTAEVFGRLLDEPRVLRELVGLSDSDALAVVRARRLQTLLSIRRGIVSTTFERAALEQPGADLDALSLDIERRLSGAMVPRGTEPTWAASAFLATYPAYTQSYQLAAVVAVQVRAALKARFGEDFISPRAGRWLADRMMADGARWTLREKLVAVAGSPLDPGPLLRFVNEP